MEKSEKKLILMVGVPGSGKSTWIQNHEYAFKPNHRIISRDEIRFSMLKDGEDYFAHENEVWNEFVREVRQSLAECDETYVDATHLNEASRTKILRALGKSLKSVKLAAITFKIPLQTCLDRNENRKGLAYVPPTAIRRMNSQLTIPSFDEGFDEIYIYKDNHLTKLVKE